MPNMTLTSAFTGNRPDLADAFWQMDPAGVRRAGSFVFPFANVSTQAGTIESLTRASFLQAPNLYRAASSPFGRVGMAISPITYQCYDRGIEVPVPQSDGSAVQLDREMAAMAVAQNIVLNGHESRVKTEIFNPSTFTGADLYLDTAAVWSAVGTDIPGDIEAAYQKVLSNSGMAPNALVCSGTVLSYLLKNTAVKAYFGPAAGVITRAMLEANLAAIFGLTYLIVSDAQDASGLILGADYCQICRVAPVGSPIQTPGIGRTVAWDQDNAGGIVTVTPYWEQQCKSWIYQVSHDTDEVLFDSAFGFLLKVS